MIERSAQSGKAADASRSGFSTSSGTLPDGAEILVVLLGRIGDVIFTLPSILALKADRPDLRIDWVVEDRCSDLLLDHPAIRNLIIFPRRQFQELMKSGNRLKALEIVWRTIRRIRETRYEAVLDFQALLKSGLLTGLSHGKSKLGSPSTYGRMREGSGLFSRQVPLSDPESHLVDRHFLVVKELLGYGPRPVPFSYAVADSDRASVDRAIHESGWSGTEPTPFVLFHPFASWKTRCWPISHFASLAAEFLRAGMAVGVIGGGGVSQESTFAEMRSKVGKLLPSLDGNRFVPFMGRFSLKETGLLMTRSQLVIANDSGPMHLSSALGVRTVAIFGPTDPKRLGPYYPDTGRVLSTRLKCQPCMKRRCPIGTLCMTELEPKTVFDESIAFMGVRPPHPSFYQASRC